MAPVLAEAVLLVPISVFPFLCVFRSGAGCDVVALALCLLLRFLLRLLSIVVELCCAGRYVVSCAFQEFRDAAGFYVEESLVY